MSFSYSLEGDEEIRIETGLSFNSHKRRERDSAGSGLPRRCAHFCDIASLSADWTPPVSLGRSVPWDGGLTHEALSRARLCVANSPHLPSRWRGDLGEKRTSFVFDSFSARVRRTSGWIPRRWTYGPELKKVV